MSDYTLSAVYYIFTRHSHTSKYNDYKMDKCVNQIYTKIRIGLSYGSLGFSLLSLPPRTPAPIHVPTIGAIKYTTNHPK